MLRMRCFLMERMAFSAVVPPTHVYCFVDFRATSKSPSTGTVAEYAMRARARHDQIVKHLRLQVKRVGIVAAVARQARTGSTRL